MLRKVTSIGIFYINHVLFNKSYF